MDVVGSGSGSVDVDVSMLTSCVILLSVCVNVLVRVALISGVRVGFSVGDEGYEGDEEEQLNREAESNEDVGDVMLVSDTADRTTQTDC